MKGERAVIALGSNLDDPQVHVDRAVEEVGALAGTRLIARSALYLTQPVGYLDQPAFVNACALLHTSLEPRALLEALLAIERLHGRRRGVPNGPRTLDLDIVLYGGRMLHEHGLTIPHPKAHERAFVLAPLLDVWPDAIIPGQGPAASLREAVRDQVIERMPQKS